MNRAAWTLRRGATLVEVLVAIFVMAIGLLALLVLFPLGAVKMAQAIKDDRSAAAANNAFSIGQMRANPIGQDTSVTPAMTSPGTSPGGNMPTLTSYTYPAGTPNAGLGYDGAGYPVYVDPFGRSMPGGLWVGGTGATYGSIPRRGASFASGTSTAAYRWFTLLDDMNFDANGVPVRAGAFVERQSRYSWAYLVRRPLHRVQSVVDMTVVVYQGRTLSLVLTETAYGNRASAQTARVSPGIRFDPASKTVRVYYNRSQGKPAIKRGSWILDATMVNDVIHDRTGDPNDRHVIPDPHGFFYRVADVTEGVATTRPTGALDPHQGFSLNINRQEQPSPLITPPYTYLDLELEGYPRQSTIDPVTGRYYGVLIVLENVAEVFEKGPGWRP